MAVRRLVVVHNNVDQRSAIGKLAMWATQVGLEAGYTVTVVAKDLDPSLAGEVQHLPLHVPRAVFAYQWGRARGTVRAALGSVSYDILHTYQPQLTGMADTWHVQFLTRVAERTGSFPRGGDALARWRRSQLRMVAMMEDRYLRRVTERVKVLFPGQMMQDEFTRLYGLPIRHQILPNPAPEAMPVSAEERGRARRDLVGEFEGIVVGYLGGLDDRKGWRALADGIALTERAFLLFAGSGSEKFRDDRLAGRCRTVGYLDDLSTFLAACDVLAVPSSFDPFPLVVTEAAARGVPSITTSMVGSQVETLKYGAGVAWDGKAGSLPAVIQDIAQRHSELSAGALTLAGDLSERRMAERLLGVWEEALEFRQGRQAPASA
jgi:glycosyltransferase involved in cell wall biosynthesis